MGRTDGAHTLARSLSPNVIQFSVLWSHVPPVAWHPYGLFTLLGPVLRTPEPLQGSRSPARPHPEPARLVATTLRLAGRSFILPPTLLGSTSHLLACICWNLLFSLPKKFCLSWHLSHAICFPPLSW